MTYDLITKLLNIKTTKKIDSIIFKRILKSYQVRNESNPSNLISLFNGKASSKALNYFSYLYEAKVISLASIEETISFLELLPSNLETIPDFIPKIMISSKIISKFPDNARLKDYAQTPAFFQTNLAELQLKLEILNTLKSQMSIYPHVLDSYLEDTNYSRIVLEDSTISLDIRNEFLSLIDHGELLTNNAYSTLLFTYLTKYGYSHASNLSIHLRSRFIRENSHMLEFITNPANISLLQIAYVAFCTQEYHQADLKHLNSLKNLKGKLLYLKKLILKYHSLPNKDRKITKKALSTYLNSIYSNYLEGAIDDSKLSENLNFLDDIITPYMRINF